MYQLGSENANRLRIHQKGQPHPWNLKMRKSGVESPTINNTSDTPSSVISLCLRP